MAARLVSTSVLSGFVRRSGSPRPLARATGFITAAALVVTGGAVAAVGNAAPAVAAVTAEPATPETPLEASTLQAAQITARVRGRRVEVTDLRAETSTTWVNPDGTLTTEAHGAPIRFRDESGAWRDVDLNLRWNGDGSVSPRGHAFGLRLPGRPTGPDGNVATTQAGKGREVSLAWPGRLPAPVLSGSRATYADVTPGVDLVVEALRTGYEQFFVIRQRPAGAVSWEVPLKTKGLTARLEDDGSVSFVDAKGVVRSRFSTPIAWDAAIDPRSGSPASTAPVALAVQQKGKGRALLTVTPDAGWLADPARVFPVTVDPTYAGVTVDPSFDAFVQTGYTSDQSGATELRLGTYDGGTNKARSFLTFPTTAFKDKKIIKAHLFLLETHSYSCSARNWEVWNTDPASTATRWTSQPTWYTKYATSSETAGYSSSCPNARVSADVTNLITDWAAGARDVYTLGLRASSETDSYGWKKFTSVETSYDPYLSVTYDRPPGTPTDRATSPTTSCVTGSSRPFINTTTPTLKAKVTDPDGGYVYGKFYVHVTGDGANTLTSGTSAQVSSGSTASWAVPAAKLANGGTYSWRARGYFESLYSAYTGWCEFTVDTTAPTAPTVSSTEFPENEWSTNVGSNNTADFTAQATSSDATTLQWSLDGGTWTSAAVSGTATTVSINLPKPSAGQHTLTVRTVDRAANTGAARSYVFYYGTGVALAAPEDGQSTARRLPLDVLVDPALNGTVGAVSFEYRRGAADTWKAIPLADVYKPDNSPVGTAWPTLSGGKLSTGPLAWDAATTLAGSGVIDVRVVFANAAYTAAAVTATVDANGGGIASEGAGPGAVNLQTGSFSLDATDAGFFGLGVSRSFGSRALTEGVNDGEAGAFGPQWSSGLAAPGGSSHTTVRRTSDTSVDVVTGDGDITSFTLKAGVPANDEWVPEPGAEELVLRGALSGSTLTLSSTHGTVTTFTAQGVPGTWDVTAIDPSGGANTSQVRWVLVDGKLRVQRMVAPNAALTSTQLAACATDATPARGCRVLEVTWTSVPLTAGGTAPRVTSVRTWAYDPAVSAVTSSVVATYTYDGRGWLTSVTDPRPAAPLATSYAYDSVGRVTSMTPPGQLAWTFEYAAVGPVWDTTQLSAAGATVPAARLVQVKRPTLTPGTQATTNGTAATSVVYGVPLNATTGPAAMGLTDVAKWAQTTAPTDATAVFAADAPQTDFWGMDDTANRGWTKATVQYLDVNGRGTNHLQRGGYLDSVQYDADGNEVFALSGDNRALALEPATNPTLVELGLAGDDTATRAQLLAEVSGYETGTADSTTGLTGGSRLAWSQGPLHTAVRSDGSVTQIRATTRTSYDAGRPAGALVADVPTSERTGGLTRTADAANAALDDQRVVTTTYDWATGAPLAVATDPSAASGDEIVRSTTYDAKGRPIAEIQPKAGAAGTRTTDYYDSSASGTCSSAVRPEWDGFVCSIATGTLASGTNPQGVQSAYTYTRVGDVDTVNETANGATRLLDVDYDVADRPRLTTVSGSGLGTAVPVRTITYDPATGAQKDLSATISGSTKTITKLADALGRPWRYVDASGLTTTTAYDALDRPTSSTQLRGSASYSTTIAYDATSGLAASQSDTHTGTTTVGYDTAGNPTNVVYGSSAAHGLVMRQRFGPTGAAVQRSWEVDDPATPGSKLEVLSESVTPNTHSQWVEHSTMTTGQRRYRYDGVGRLTGATELFAADCAVRSYAFDSNGNRTGEKYVAAAATADSSGDLTVCPTPTAPTITHSFDLADRMVDPGYVYDAFGRTSRLPLANGQVQRVSYNVTDLVASQSVFSSAADADANGGAGQNAISTQNYTMDPTGERLLATSTITSSSTTPKAYQYAGDGDSPAFVDENTSSAAAGIVTRNLAGPAGGLQATVAIDKSGSSAAQVTWQLTNLHGDVAAALPADEQLPIHLQTTDEYGLAATPGSTRYGWLGGHQRAGDTPGGTYLMGVRLYNPNTGRFLSVDPVFGGNENAYNYPNDPVNMYDLDGRWCRWCLIRALGIARWAIQKAGQLCSRFGGVWGIACAMLGGGLAAVLGYIIVQMKKHEDISFRALQWVFFWGAGEGLWATYGRYVSRFIFSTPLGNRIWQFARRTKFGRQVTDMLLDWMTKNGFK